MSALFGNWKILLVVAVAAFIAGGYATHKWYRAGMVSELKSQILNLQAQDEVRRMRAEVLEKALADLQNKKEVRYVEVKKFIDRPVYRECVVDDDGVRTLREAIAATNAARKRAYSDK